MRQGNHIPLPFLSFLSYCTGPPQSIQGSLRYEVNHHAFNVDDLGGYG